MAIDYGDAHTGVALSDLTGSLAGYTEVIHSWREAEVIRRIGELIDAHNILRSAGRSGKKRKKTVDAVAAALILEGYLTYRKT